MSTFFAFVFFFALIALPISILKPGIFAKFYNSTRAKNALILGAILFASFILFGITSPTPSKNASESKEIKTPAAKTEAVDESRQTEVEALTPAPTETPTPTVTEAPTPTVAPTKIPTAVPTKKAVPTTIVYPTATPANMNIAPQATSGGFSCNCSKTCPQISSCAEAQYLLNECGCGARDGDNDGTACDGAPLHCQN